MPYSNIGAAKEAGFPTSAEGVDLTIAQINHLARIYDSIKAAGTADNPMAVAWTTWKGLYIKKGNKWVKKETKKAAETFSCECIECGYKQESEEHCSELKCPECGGQMRRASRPGPGKASERFSFISELPIKLFEEDLPTQTSEIQILRVGKWKHPQYGKFEIAPKDLVLFKENFENRVRRVEIAVDTEHFPEKGAAGWIKSLMLRGEEQLWALVEWTKWGIEAIKGKLFQYISPEFDFTYKDAETGQKFRNVLHAVTLTNRPFLKDMFPVILSEKGLKSRFIDMFMEEETEKGGVVDMELKELVGLVGLKEDATEEQVKDNIKKLFDGSKDLVEISKALGLKEDATKDDITKKLKETLEKVKELSEGGDGKVVFTDKEAAQLKEAAKNGAEAVKKLNEKEAEDKVSDAMRKGKITPKTKDWATKYALNDPEGFKTFIESAPVVVKVEERGSQGEGKLDLSDDKGHKKLDDRAKALMSEKKIPYKEALDMARKEAENEQE